MAIISQCTKYCFCWNFYESALVPVHFRTTRVAACACALHRPIYKAPCVCPTGLSSSNRSWTATYENACIESRILITPFSPDHFSIISSYHSIRESLLIIKPFLERKTSHQHHFLYSNHFLHRVDTYLSLYWFAA